MSEETYTEEELNEWESTCGGWCQCGNVLHCDECEDEIRLARERNEAEADLRRAMGEGEQEKDYSHEDRPHRDQLGLGDKDDE